MASGSDNAISDEVIKRRLLIDGDGMGDERKLNVLMKAYLTFLESEDSEDADAASVRRLTSQVKQMEYVARRTVESIKMNEEAEEVYVDLGDKVQAEIEETKRQIEESKALLEEATKHRKYSMEYDALAKLIESKADRKLTEEKRARLETELDALRKRKEILDEQLDSRKRSVSMLSSTIQLLRDQLDTPDETFVRKSIKSSRHRHLDGGMDVDSTSQSEPPSPMDTQNSQDSVKVPVELPEAKNDNEGSSVPANSNEKLKSEKYEDLSESDGDENS